MKLPAKLGLPGAKTRFDELQAIHQLQAYATHFVVRDSYLNLRGKKIEETILTPSRVRSFPSTA